MCGVADFRPSNPSIAPDAIIPAPMKSFMTNLRKMDLPRARRDSIAAPSSGQAREVAPAVEILFRMEHSLSIQPNRECSARARTARSRNSRSTEAHPVHEGPQSTTLSRRRHSASQTECRSRTRDEPGLPGDGDGPGLAGRGGSPGEFRRGCEHGSMAVVGHSPAGLLSSGFRLALLGCPGLEPADDVGGKALRESGHEAPEHHLGVVRRLTGDGEDDPESHGDVALR